MGSWFSKSSEEKKVDATGQVNNQIQISDTVNVYSIEIVILLLGILLIKIFEVACYIYVNHNRRLKKKYSANST